MINTDSHFLILIVEQILHKVNLSLEALLYVCCCESTITINAEPWVEQSQQGYKFWWYVGDLDQVTIFDTFLILLLT